ncbi:MAG: FHA domain-containing protein [Deltaproteobacteria bacterium]|nr:FHA domain-containing protein [Deltaproteobacteria bacterium]
MPACVNCGKDNRDGSRFCQACGSPLAPVPATNVQAARPAAPRPPSQEVSASATCTVCSTVNAPGMRFCKNCGTPLAVGAPQKVGCPSCGGQTPLGYKFCQHCGTPLPLVGATAPPVAPPPAWSQSEVQTAPPEAPTQPAQPAVSAPRPPIDPAAHAPSPDVAKTLMDLTSERALAGLPPLSEGQAATLLTPGALRAEGPGDVTPPAGMRAVEPPAVVRSVAARAPVGASTMGPGARRATSEPVLERQVLARLVSVRRDGTDGETHPIAEESFDLGRLDGQLVFNDDPYLSERHARFYIADGNWMVQDLGSRNGVFARVDQPATLHEGDMLLLGKQVFRFDQVSDAERAVAPAVEDGVLIFGSPLRPPWGRLRQLTVAGIHRDIYYLYRPRVVIGREDGDYIFPDDEFMSRQHLSLSLVGSAVQAQDLGSSNGTFLRVRQQLELRPGQMLRIGDQLLRFELP